MNQPARHDWQRLRERLEASRGAMEKLWTPDEARVLEVLRARAEHLARPVETGAAGEQIEVLVFRLGEERYGIEMHGLAAVLPSPRCARVPGGRKNLAGVIQLRGEMRAVWDLRRLLGLPSPEGSTPDCVLLVRQDGREYGLRVDAVEEIRRMRREELEPAPVHSRHAAGVTPDLTVILNLETILKNEEVE